MLKTSALRRWGLSFLAVPLGVGFASGCGSSKPPAEQAEASASSASAETVPARLPPQKIVFAFSGRQDDFRKCFLLAATTRGSVTARFEVDERGRVQEASVLRSTIGRDEVDGCLLKRLREQAFGQLEAQMSAEWTFVFRLIDPIPTKDFSWRLKKEQRKQPEDGIVVTEASRGWLEANRIGERVQVRFPLFAHCYRAAIDRNRRAAGIVRLRLEVDATGKVIEVGDAGSVVPDPYALDCIAEGFYAMDLPPPDGGPVQILYRLDLE